MVSLPSLSILFTAKTSKEGTAKLLVIKFILIMTCFSDI